MAILCDSTICQVEKATGFKSSSHKKKIDARENGHQEDHKNKV